MHENVYIGIPIRNTLSSRLSHPRRDDRSADRWYQLKPGYFCSQPGCWWVNRPMVIR